MLNLLKKLIGVSAAPKDGQDSVKRISQSIQSIKSNEETTIFDSGDIEFSQDLMAKKFDLISSVLEEARQKAMQFEELVGEVAKAESVNTNPEQDFQTPEQNFQNIVQEIIDNCKGVSINGLKVLAGDEVNINVNEKKVKIQLPDLVSSLASIQSGSSAACDMQHKVEELATAIIDSESELEKYLVELEVAEQNLHSAGISVDWLKSASKNS